MNTNTSIRREPRHQNRTARECKRPRLKGASSAKKSGRTKKRVLRGMVVVHRPRPLNAAHSILSLTFASSRVCHCMLSGVSVPPCLRARIWSIT